MKKTLIIIFAILTTTYAEAQDDSGEVKTLINKYNEVKGFGAVDFKVTDVISKKALFAGAYGGVIINKQVMLGLGGYGLATSISPPGSGDGDIDLEGGYGGLMLGFIIAPREVVHVTVPLFIGGGSFHKIDRNFDVNAFPREVTLRTSSFAVAEPGLQVELNVSRLVRIGFGASYRYIQGTNFSDITDKDLSSFSGNITVKVGRF